jgi:hypothetical protein
MSDNEQDSEHFSLSQETLLDTLQDYGYSYQQSLLSLETNEWNLSLALESLLNELPSAPPELQADLSSDSQEKLDLYRAIYGNNDEQVKSLLFEIASAYREGSVDAEQRASLKYDLLTGVELEIIQSQLRRLLNEHQQQAVKITGRNYLAPREGIQLQRHLSQGIADHPPPPPLSITSEEEEHSRILENCDLDDFGTSPSSETNLNLLQRRVDISDQDQEYENSLSADRLKFLQRYQLKLTFYALLCQRYQITSNYRQWKHESLQNSRSALSSSNSFLRLVIQFPQLLFPFPTIVPYASTQHLLHIQSLFNTHIPPQSQSTKETFHLSTQTLRVVATSGEETCHQSLTLMKEQLFLFLHTKILDCLIERWVHQIEMLPENIFGISTTQQQQPGFITTSSAYLEQVMTDRSRHYSQEEMNIYETVRKGQPIQSSRIDLSSGLSYTLSLAYPRTPLYHIHNGRLNIIPSSAASSAPTTPTSIDLFSDLLRSLGLDSRGGNLCLEDLECSWNVLFGYDYQRAD